MFFSNTHWPQLTAPFYSILFETSICQFNSSKFSPIMPDEVREHLTRDHSETIPSSRIMAKNIGTLGKYDQRLLWDQKPFLHPESWPKISAPLVNMIKGGCENHSRSFRFTTPWRCFSSSVHLTHFLQGSGQRTGMAIAEAWFCAQWPIFVLFLRFVFGLLYGWKIQTWPIIRFLTESVTYWFFICWYLIESMMPCV